MLNAKECREQAMKCVKQAGEATDPILKQRLSETAQGWNRLAADLAKLEEKLPQEQPAAQTMMSCLHSVPK
jgi:hypothetical protein